MRKKFALGLLCFSLLSACGPNVTAQPLEATAISATKPQVPATSTLGPLVPTQNLETGVPTLTATPGPIIDPQGNITWHPQEVLIAWEVGGGDGAGFDYPPEFVLLWDGTLLQQGPTRFGAPYVSHLDQDEMCKILNTVDSSGFFEEPREYTFPFDGYSSQYITVNAWKSNSSGSQIFTYALSGAPYYDGLFCRNCPLPSEHTIIQPGLANVYFLLRGYTAAMRELAPVDKLQVYLDPVEEEPTHTWPITSISPSELAEKCDQSYCYDAGMILDGAVAKEIRDKLGGDEVFKVEQILDSTPFRVTYRVVWPYEPSIMYYSGSDEPQQPVPPADYRMTCNPVDGRYPLLPLSKENKYWAYSPDGNWGMEVVNVPEQILKVRVVNKSGYEKYYEYDPALLSQSSLKVFPRFWTVDSEYLFINILPEGFDSTYVSLVNSIGLQRISISDGTVSYMFAGVEGQQYAYTMSENGGQVAYIRQEDQPLKIVIKDTYSGKEKAATLSVPVNGTGFYVNAGTLIWSVDEQTIYLAATYRENGTDGGRLIAVDVSNPASQRIIYDSTATFKLNQLSFHDWEAGLCFQEATIDSYCPLRLNLETGTVP